MKNADAYASDFMLVYEEFVFKMGVDKKKALTDTVIFICRRLVEEVGEIGSARKAYCDSAWKAIVKEQNQKWVAIVRRLDLDKLPLLPQADAFQTVWDHFKVETLK